MAWHWPLKNSQNFSNQSLQNEERKAMFLLPFLTTRSFCQNLKQRVFRMCKRQCSFFGPSLGFIIHPDKSVLEPTQQIQYVGVVIDSRDMSVRLTAERKCNLKDTCNKLLKARKLTIRDLAKVIGKIVASFTAVKYGPLYYRHLEETKKAALQVAKGDYDSPVSINFSARAELQWWVDNVTTASNDITPSAPDITVASDASMWGEGGGLSGRSFRGPVATS